MIIEVWRDYVSSFAANGGRTQKLQTKHRIPRKFRTVIQNPEPTSTIRNSISTREPLPDRIINSGSTLPNPDPTSLHHAALRSQLASLRDSNHSAPPSLRKHEVTNPLRNSTLRLHFTGPEKRYVSKVGTEFMHQRSSASKWVRKSSFRYGGRVPGPDFHCRPILPPFSL